MSTNRGYDTDKCSLNISVDTDQLSIALLKAIIAKEIIEKHTAPHTIKMFENLIDNETHTENRWPF